MLSTLFWTSISTIICTFFFFKPPAAHRTLHSFPTRRSSDLPTIKRIFETTEQNAQNKPYLYWDVMLSAHQDRKSTRLNSSHRTISYAVFCLKKKTSSRCLIHRVSPTRAGTQVATSRRQGLHS